MQQQVGRIWRLKIRVWADVIQLPCSSPQLQSVNGALCRCAKACKISKMFCNIHKQQCRTTAVTERLLAAFVLS